MLLLPRSAEEVEAVLEVLAHNVHLIVETVLVAAIAVLILQKQYKPRRSKPLTEEVRFWNEKQGVQVEGMDGRTEDG